MTTASCALLFHCGGFLMSVHALFLANPCFTFIQFQIFMAESLPVPPQTSRVGHSAASPEHYSSRSPLCRLTKSLSFNTHSTVSKIILFTFKTWEAVIHQAVAVAHWANCALRLRGATVHHDGSSINWKSVSCSGA